MAKPVKQKSHMNLEFLRYFFTFVLTGVLVFFSPTLYAENLCTDANSSAATGSLFDSGGAGGNYINNEDCTFLIQPAGATSVTFTFSSFNVEDGFDFVRVYDGATTTSPLLGTFTGTTLPAALTATSGTMLVRITTDFSITRSGIAATWSSSSAPSTTANIVVTLPGNVREIDAGSIAISGANAGAPEATATNTVTNQASITTNITTLTNNALLIDVAGSGEPANYTSGAGQTERWEEINFSATGVLSTKGVTTAGSTSMTESQSSSSRRMAQALVSIAPATAGSTPAIDSLASTNGQTVNTLSWTQSLPTSGSNGKLIVGIAIEEGSACPANSTVTSVTYNGTSMTRAVFEQVTQGGFCIRTEIWYADVSIVTPPASNRIVLSSDGGATLGGLTFEDEDLVDYTPTTDTAVMFREGDTIFDNDEDVNAVFVRDNGNLILSTNGNSSVGGTSFEDEDLIEYNPNTSTATLFLDGDAVFSAEEDIDGVYVLDNGNILLSTDGGATIGGLSFNDEDIVEYDPGAGTATMYLDGSTVFGGGTDLRGIHVLDNGNVVLSIDNNNISLGGISFSDDDLVEYNRGTDTATLFFDGSNFSGSEDVDAVHVIEVPTSATLDHFDINTGGATGSVCLPQQVTIRACADASCSTLVTDYADTVEVSTSSGVGNWSIVTGNGSIAPNPDNDDNGIVDYNFDATDGGTIILALIHTLAASTTITVTDGSISDTSSGVQFNENAFLIEDIDSLPGTDVPVGGRDHQYRATMIARTNSASPQCSVVTSYTGSQDLKGWVNRTGSDPGGVAPTIGAVSLPNSAPGADNLTVTFTAGITTFNLSTSDIGQYSINLQEDSVVIPTIPPTNVPVSVTGSSNTATVRPFGLDTDFSGQRSADWLDDGVINDSTGSNTSFAQNQNGTAFVSAGANFSATARGVLWQTVDDNNVVGGDGVPDTGANLTDNSAAASFGQEGETVTLTHTLVLPAGGSNGSLTGGLVNSFTNGVGTTNLAWDEVGVIDLAANLTDNDYLGSGVDVSGVVQDVGRFTPDHFVLSAGSITEACVPGAGTPFTYLGQDLSGQFTLTAENTGNNTTTNYRGVFVKLDGASGTLDYDAVDGAAQLAVTPSGKTGTTFSWSNGVGTLSFTLSVDKGLTPAGPFNASIGVDPEDADLVTLLTGGFDLDTNPGAAGNEHALIDASNQRFGRIRGVGAFGPETQTLPVPILVEYYDGSNFVTNVDDACTTLVAANFDLNVVDDDSSPDNSNDPAAGVIAGLVIDVGASNGSIGNSPFITGDAGFSFSAPGTANTSKIEINLDMDALINPLPWLKYDWLNGGSETNPPQFDAVFGRYRGNDRIIYWREVFN